MQKLTNIVFILILILMGTALPLNTQIMNINLTEPIITTPGNTDTTEHGALQGKITLLRPDYDAIVDERSDLVLVFESDNAVFHDDFFRELRPTLVVTAADGAQQRIDLSDQTARTSGASQREIRIPYRQIAASIEDSGYYRMHLELFDRKLEAALNGSWLLSTLDYSGKPLSVRTDADPIPAGQIPLTLYVPDREFRSVTPITRILPDSSLDWHRVYLALRDGVSPTLGLRPAPTIPTLMLYDLTSGAAVLDLAADTDKYASTPEQIQVLGQAIHSTYMSYRRIRGTTLRVGGKVIFEEVARVQPTSYRISRTSTDHLVLQPVTLAESTDAKAAVRDVVSRLQKDHVLPPTIELEEFFLTPEDGALEVHLSPEYQTLLRDKPEYRELVRAAVALSFYSIPEVRSLKINGETIPRIIAWNLEPQ
ncbi:MAG: hypothetical protein Q4A52_08185 [Bacillota bacterium]|nr:hypothetical protein [Bacillota bacterium]